MVFHAVCESRLKQPVYVTSYPVCGHKDNEVITIIYYEVEWALVESPGDSVANITEYVGVYMKTRPGGIFKWKYKVKRFTRVNNNEKDVLIVQVTGTECCRQY